ncbi:hypothetical protein K7W42_11610 [Deinococcus sp. HMF7604]|uniref:hypothetical protein n=1 Tax=Deinococcus betulae TaxID=2873312 RepID=UPI001CCE343E|nr:hypothetical protein [Deinococcus betulae]MBZ9751510.1 hypothetical protein [Deinococcus betulae]
MAQPRKRRGYRSIMVDGQHYTWRFQAGQNAGVLTVLSPDQPATRFTVHLPESLDPWLSESQPKVMPAVTPAVVAAILRAVVQGDWSMDQSKAAHRMEWRDGLLYQRLLDIPATT